MMRKGGRYLAASGYRWKVRLETTQQTEVSKDAGLEECLEKKFDSGARRMTLIDSKLVTLEVMPVAVSKRQSCGGCSKDGGARAELGARSGVRRRH